MKRINKTKQQALTPRTAVYDIDTVGGRFEPTIDKDIKLANMLWDKAQDGVRNSGLRRSYLEIVNEAGYPYITDAAASDFIQQKKKEKGFKVMYEAIKKGLDPEEEFDRWHKGFGVESDFIIDSPNKILKAYSDLFLMATNINDRDEKGKPNLYNPETARKILNDLGHYYSMFVNEKNVNNLQVNIGSVTEVELLLNRIEDAERLLPAPPAPMIIDTIDYDQE